MGSGGNVTSWPSMAWIYIEEEKKTHAFRDKMKGGDMQLPGMMSCAKREVLKDLCSSAQDAQTVTCVLA